MPALKHKAVFVGLASVLVAVIVSLLLGSGFTARGQPSTLEAYVARKVRDALIPSSIAEMRNPVVADDRVLAEGLEHFADHCASCHANDGSGETAIGRNLYPPAPDMRGPPTQELRDGELFYLIHNGVPLTGMPAWGDGDFEADTETWSLVHFIRHLPNLTAEDLAAMRQRNPKNSHEIEEERSMREFLTGGMAPSGSKRSHGSD